MYAGFFQVQHHFSLHVEQLVHLQIVLYPHQSVVHKCDHTVFYGQTYLTIYSTQAAVIIVIHYSITVPEHRPVGQSVYPIFGCGVEESKWILGSLHVSTRITHIEKEQRLPVYLIGVPNHERSCETEQALSVRIDYPCIVQYVGIVHQCHTVRKRGSRIVLRPDDAVSICPHISPLVATAYGQAVFHPQHGVYTVIAFSRQRTIGLAEAILTV